MGLVAQGKFEAGWIETFSIEALKALATARKSVESGAADAAFARWFGDVPDAAERKEVGKLLGVVRSNINIRSISVGFMALKHRKANQNARAWNVKAPQLDLGTALAGPGAGGINTIELDLNFKSLPDYLPTLADGSVDSTAGHQSKFETVLHELTHVLLGTADAKLDNGHTAYGAQAAELLATQAPERAILNAENWGIFIEAVGRNEST
mgnify:CR=1 FL=1